MFKRTSTPIFFLSFIFLASQCIKAQPIGYYDNAQGLTGEPLRTALYTIIDNHSSVTYSDLWGHFADLDQKANGKLWDIYSDDPSGTPAYEYSLVTDQCGQYSGEGDCYNREHSVPHSWFNAGSPMYTDLFHIYPTDGFVNGKHSSYPYGETNNPTWTGTNGSRLGSHSLSGYSGVVFEPIDEYKGDLARTYFYMITRYMNVAQNWSSDMLTGNTFSNWTLDMLMNWAANDPVSQKEIDRNEAIYQVQNNRNPFIDIPTYSLAIWDPTFVGIDDHTYTKAKITYSNSMLTLQTSNDALLMVYDLLGRPLLQREAAGTTQIAITLPQGYYMAVITEAKGTSSKRFVVF